MTGFNLWRARPHRHAWLVFFLSFAVYMSPGRYTGSLDTIPQIFLPLTVFAGTPGIFDDFHREDPRKAEHWFAKNQSGHYISTYPLVPGWLHMPVATLALIITGSEWLSEHSLIVAKVSAALLSAWSVSLMFLVFVHLGLNSSQVVLLTIAYGFGTTLWSVTAGGLWNQTASVWLQSIVLYLWFSDRRSAKALLILGASLGFMVVNRPPTLMVALPLLYILARNEQQRRAPLAVGLSLSALYYGVSAAVFGTPSGSLANFGGTMIGTQYFSWRLGGPLLAHLFSPNRGLLVFSPFLIFAVFGVIEGVRRADHSAITKALAGGIVAEMIIYSSWYVWWGGYGFAYRILSDLIPWLLFFVAMGLKFKSFRGRDALLAAAVGLAVATHTLGAFQAPCGFDVYPESINTNPGRVWDLRGGELARCWRKILED